MTHQQAEPLRTSLVSTAIPYVNAAPHLGYAFEAVLADSIARWRKLAGGRVHHQAGTDDNSLKNVRAAAALGVSTRALVDNNAAHFHQLRELLNLSWDSFVRTSSDPWHRELVEAIWQRCQQRGDIYRGSYTGLYCEGCEQFFVPAELSEGACPEHGTLPEVVHEENYFFRLSRYQAQLRDLVTSRKLRILPEERHREVLAWIDAGLHDFSVSRPSSRSHGWGLAVPGDSSQVIYVWFDALINYLSGLGANGLELWQRAERIEHVIGKGILRFHALCWPALLLSAGLRTPSRLLVHGYLSVEGRKIGKSLGNAIDPKDVVGEFGLDPLRYYLLRHIRSTRDADFSRQRLLEAHDSELADQLGNLLHRTLALVERARGGLVPNAAAPGELERELARQSQRVRNEVAQAVEAFALHDALSAIWRLVASTNRYIDQVEPWALAKQERAGAPREALDRVLTTLLQTLRAIALLLQPFLPDTAREIVRRVGGAHALNSGAVFVQTWPPLFPKRTQPHTTTG